MTAVVKYVQMIVQKKGLEPSWYCYHTDLNRARLPIPPFLHLLIGGTALAVGPCLHVEPSVRRSRTLMGDTPFLFADRANRFSGCPTQFNIPYKKSFVNPLRHPIIQVRIYFITVEFIEYLMSVAFIKLDRQIPDARYLKLLICTLNALSHTPARILIS